MNATEATLHSSGHDPALLLATMQRQSIEPLCAALDRVLQRADDFLFDRSANGSDGIELTSLRDLRRARAGIARGFESGLLAAFRRLSHNGDVNRGPRVELSLVDEEALEQQLADEQMVDRLGRIHAPALDALQHRLGALLGRAALAPRDNPAGPVAIANALREALRTAQLPTSVHIVLFKFLERELGAALHPLYQRLNDLLAEAGVLPAFASTQQGEPVPPPVEPPVAAAPEASWDQVPDAPREQALFASLLGMLQDWRRGSGVAGSGGAAGGQRLQANEVLSVLTRMQGAPPPSLDHVLDEGRSSLAELLRREVLLAARRFGVGGEQVQLSAGDEDAVDLVGMLFDVLLDERDFEPQVRRKIGRLLVPYVKVAVKDRRLFLSKVHPARKLLNVVAEACEGNHGEAPQERELLDRVDGTIERLVAEYNEDVAIFETLEQDLRAFMAQHRKRVELSERRAAEAQRGRERLEQARTEAGADLARRRGDRELPQAIEDFLSSYAQHHLTQVILRDTRDSARYGQALHAVIGLLAAFDHADLGEAPDRLPALDGQALVEILASSGCVGQAAEQAVAILRDTVVQLALGNRVAVEAARLPEQPPAPAPAAPEPELPFSVAADFDYDPALAERIRALPMGTWVQLTSGSGRTEPAKASWVSPISGRVLFVNRRGIRVLVASPEELAAMCAQGRMKLREADTAFDDAMQQMLGRLQAATPVGGVATVA